MSASVVAGPLLALQADKGLSGLVASLADQIEAKDEILAKEAREHLVFLKQGIEKSPTGTNHEQRYLALHKQCAQRIAVHHVISHFLQKEIWAMYRDANTQSQNVQDIIANYAAEDRYYERCEKVLSKVLPMLDDSIKALEANVPV